MKIVKMCCQPIDIFKQVVAYSAFPGLVSVNAFVRLPALIVTEGCVAQVARVAELVLLGFRLKIVTNQALKKFKEHFYNKNISTGCLKKRNDFKLL